MAITSTFTYPGRTCKELLYKLFQFQLSCRRKMTAEVLRHSTYILHICTVIAIGGNLRVGILKLHVAMIHVTFNEISNTCSAKF